MDEKLPAVVTPPFTFLGAVGSLFLAYRIAVLLTEPSSKGVTRPTPDSYRRWQERIVARKNASRSRLKM